MDRIKELTVKNGAARKNKRQKKWLPVTDFIVKQEEMSSWSWNSREKFETVMEVVGKDHIVKIKASTTVKPDYGPCLSSGHRRCADGSCIARVDLCPEEQMMNENTILIMIVVGMAVVIFLVILYCFQQRANRRSQSSTSHTVFDTVVEDGDNESLNMPPPTYEEVVTTDLYPPTPILQRNTRMSSVEEPRTPPPNYDAALHILAHSHESVFPMKTESKSPVVRRSVSTEFGSTGSARQSRSSEMDYRRVFSNPENR